MIHDADMAERVLRMINAGEIEARAGEIVSVSPEISASTAITRRP